jgi:hypothetical protein
MPDGDEVRRGEGIILGHIRQPARFVRFVVPPAFVLALFIGGEEAGEGDHRSGCGKFCVPAIRCHRTEADRGG